MNKVRRQKSGRKKKRGFVSTDHQPGKKKLRSLAVSKETLRTGSGPIKSGGMSTLKNPPRISKSYFEREAGKKFES